MASADYISREVAEGMKCQIGIKCQICDTFIPIVSVRHAYPHICDECKKRLKELLYPKE